MGDANEEVENSLIGEFYDLKADVYRISHHGSPTSTNHDIINAVNPKIAIISVGDNLYGHPSNDVIQRLNDKNCKILRTDYNGAIIYEYNLNTVKIKTMIE